jgi:hypothetical protein
MANVYLSELLWAEYDVFVADGDEPDLPVACSVSNEVRDAQVKPEQVAEADMQLFFGMCFHQMGDITAATTWVVAGLRNGGGGKRVVQTRNWLQVAKDASEAAVHAALEDQFEGIDEAARAKVLNRFNAETPEAVEEPAAVGGAR